MARGNYPTPQEVIQKTEAAQPGQAGQPGQPVDPSAPIVEAIQTLAAFVGALKNAGNPRAEAAQKALQAFIDTIKPNNAEKGKPEPAPAPAKAPAQPQAPAPQGPQPMPMAQGMRPMGAPASQPETKVQK